MRYEAREEAHRRPRIQLGEVGEGERPTVQHRQRHKVHEACRGVLKAELVVQHAVHDFHGEGTNFDALLREARGKHERAGGTPRAGVRRQRQIQAPVEGAVVQDVPVAASAVVRQRFCPRGVEQGVLSFFAVVGGGEAAESVQLGGGSTVRHSVQLKTPAFLPLGYRDGLQVGVDAPGGEGAVEGGAEHANLGRSRARSVLLSVLHVLLFEAFEQGQRLSAAALRILPLLIGSVRR